MIMKLIFNSIFKQEFQDFIKLKQSLVLKYETDSRILARFDKFLYEHNLQGKFINKSIIEEWCVKRSYESIANRNARVSTARVFTNYLLNLGYEVYVPPLRIYNKGPKYEAHIYTDDELSRFFKVVDQSKDCPYSAPYRSKLMPLFFRVLYTSGLRVSELRLLKLKNCHFENDYITVIDGKNHKDRNVPINHELSIKCRKLLKTIHKDSTEEEYFFMIVHGRCMTVQNVYKNFRKYLERADIPHTGKGPRIHDFRHTYCVNLLRNWVDQDKNLLNYLPYMKTMLGHETFHETAYYLKLTQQVYPQIIIKLESSIGTLIDNNQLGEIDDEKYY